MPWREKTRMGQLRVLAMVVAWKANISEMDGVDPSGCWIHVIGLASSEPYLRVPTWARMARSVRLATVPMTCGEKPQRRL